MQPISEVAQGYIWGFYTGWFKQNPGVVLVWHSGDHHFTSAGLSNSPPPPLHPSIPISSQQWVPFPHRGLLTAFKPRKMERGPLPLECIASFCSPHRWAKVASTQSFSHLSQAVGLNAGSIIHQWGAVTLSLSNQQPDSLIDFHKPPLISRHKAYLTKRRDRSSNYTEATAFHSVTAYVPATCQIFVKPNVLASYSPFVTLMHCTSSHKIASLVRCKWIYLSV